jgi:hypothetical protein
MGDVVLMWCVACAKVVTSRPPRFQGCFVARPWESPTFSILGEKNSTYSLSDGA